MAKISTKNSLYKTILGLGALGLLLVLPTGIYSWFDGLPWTGEVETVTLSVIIPFLLILSWKFISQRSSILCISALLLLKAVLFFGSPSSGLLVKVYPNLTEQNFLHPLKKVKNKVWTPTYATLWNANASGILQTPWVKKIQFPLDWVLFTADCIRKSDDCYDSVNAIIEIEGALLIPKGKKFFFLTNGMDEGTLIATNERGNSIVVFPSRNIEDGTKQKYQLPEGGIWKISGKFSYSGPEWSFIPALIQNNGQAVKDLGRDVLWQNYDDLLSSSSNIWFYKLLSRIVDGGIIIFLLLWIISILNQMVKIQVLSIPFSIFCVSVVCIPYIIAPFFAKFLKVFGLSDVVNTSCLGVSILIVGVSFLTWAKWQKDYRNLQADKVIQSVLIFFGPALLFYFSNKWWPIIGQGYNWGAGDDWVAYQAYARNIFVGGDWLRATEGPFTMQPLYRYIVGFYHWLFGQSVFAQNIADIWCILGAAFIIAFFAAKFRVSASIIFIACITYFSINLIGAFRYHLGKGLTESHAMIFLVLCAWFLYKAREGGTKPIVLATLFGIFGYWTRIDHLGAVVCVAFLLLEPVNGPTGGWKDYWGRLQLEWKKFAIYWGFGIISVLLICFRNWSLGGAFFVSNINHANFTMDLERASYFVILTGVEWGNIPPISGFIVMLGVLVALFTLIWRPKPLLNFPLSLGIIFVGLLAPYAVLWTNGYLPRWSTHILPLSVLVLAILLERLPWVHRLLPGEQLHL
jgi:hypothetical protein